MEVLVLDGRKYIKASKAANELGYTADYVGQLCRSGKVNAHLIGRSWYVDQDELSTHRREKKRMSRIKAREQAKRSIEAHRKKINSPKETYKDITILYEKDSSDLIPKTRRINVELEVDRSTTRGKSTKPKKTSRKNIVENKDRKAITYDDDTDIEEVDTVSKRSGFMDRLEEACVVSSDYTFSNDTNSHTPIEHTRDTQLLQDQSSEGGVVGGRYAFLLPLIIVITLTIITILTVTTSQIILYTSESVIPVSNSFNYSLQETLVLLKKLF